MFISLPAARHVLHCNDQTDLVMSHKRLTH